MSRADTCGVILAGGLSRRMGGGDKPLRELGGRPMLARVIERLAPQCAELAINANGDPARFAGFGLPVWPDTLPGHPGPLAGILAALESSPLPWVATVTGDAPFLPPDLVERLHASGAALACAASAGRVHPPVGLWPRRLAGELRAAILDGERRVGAWAARHGVATVEWEGDPFFNVNTPEELAEAARRLREPPPS
ncbi:molybdenum cofactor guanylyltransferase MobA [Roseococcus sp. SYP-B2431]|uniref:molybdenum cofactor guanylyltransferase MobA n=1 Tax=Roseococcus sp. SYP-B2431 TaxID=2496640 RepID=UPI00103BDBD5|nr:molybdenum cofactor guanylyltransferase MobA [Roseococcus sp. SYP-B2431]TCH96806.1 molybdenum cofactor guanylyltransferase MobA [Roseococcus sp. SYP-B2431]